MIHESSRIPANQHQCRPIYRGRIRRRADLARPLEAPLFASIETALHDRGFVVFPGQTLDPGQFVAFARRWGPPEPHVIDTFHHPADR